LACIQGPPGIGKSFCGVKLILVLLDNNTSQTHPKLGPILIVCHTNHVLDQLLEPLVLAGVKQVVRIGSRSKSELLAPLNLNEIVRNEGFRTKQEKITIWYLIKALEHQHRRLTHLSTELARSGSWDSVRDIAPFVFPDLLQVVENAPDEEGFQTFRVLKNKEWAFQQWIDADPQRRILHQEWIAQVKEPLELRFIEELYNFVDS
jgi:hypothetical protein